VQLAPFFVGSEKSRRLTLELLRVEAAELFGDAAKAKRQ
jgi:hypothetical protein